MKQSIKHGGAVRCDMVTVDAELDFKNECDVKFISYSLSSLVRAQALNANWSRVKASRVKWPGNPPCKNSRKVDLCPMHSALVMTEEEYAKAKEEAKAKRKAERELARAEAKAKAKAQAAKPKKARASRKKAETTEVTL